MLLPLYEINWRPVQGVGYNTPRVNWDGPKLAVFLNRISSIESEWMAIIHDYTINEFSVTI